VGGGDQGLTGGLGGITAPNRKDKLPQTKKDRGERRKNLSRGEGEESRGRVLNTKLRETA